MPQIERRASITDETEQVAPIAIIIQRSSRSLPGESPIQFAVSRIARDAIIDWRPSPGSRLAGSIAILRALKVDSLSAIRTKKLVQTPRGVSITAIDGLVFPEEEFVRSRIDDPSRLRDRSYQFFDSACPFCWAINVIGISGLALE